MDREREPAEGSEWGERGMEAERQGAGEKGRRWQAGREETSEGGRGHKKGDGGMEGELTESVSNFTTVVFHTPGLSDGSEGGPEPRRLAFSTERRTPESSGPDSCRKDLWGDIPLGLSSLILSYWTQGSGSV